MQTTVDQIGIVEAAPRAPEDNNWGGTRSTITLADSVDASALDGIEAFSHVEVLFLFHGVATDKVVTGARHPRNNPAWPKGGIFAQQGKNRPKRIGSTICTVVGRSGRSLVVAEFDAIDGTPVLDLEPVIREVLPREATRQPAWCSEQMADDWREGA